MEESSFSVSEFFDSFEEDFNNYISDAEKALEGYESLTADDKTTNYEQSKQLWEASLRCLKQMEIEINSLPPSYKGVLNQRLTTCRSKYDSITKKIDGLTENTGVENLKTNIGKQKKSKEKNEEEVVRKRLLKSKEKSVDSTSNLDQINKTASESHFAALSIETAPQSESAKLPSAKPNSKDIAQQTLVPNSLLSRFQKRGLTWKVVLYGIILIFIFFSSYIIYIKFFA